MNTTSLSSRRHHLTVFRDLFTALFRIPDRDVQTRVLDAINGIVHDDPDNQCQCHCKRNRTFVDSSVQTLYIEPCSETRSIQIQTDSVVVSTVAVQASYPILINNHLAELQSQSSAEETVNYRVINKDIEKSEYCEVEEVATSTTTNMPKYSPISSPALSTSPTSSPKPSTTILQSLDIEHAVIRRRKRAKKIPRVEKVQDDKTRIEIIVQDNMSQGDIKRMRGNNYDDDDSPKFRRRDSVQQNNEQLVKLFNLHTPDQIHQSVISLESSKSTIELMKQEWETSLTDINGLYPIHKAIIENEMGALKRQMYVLKFRKINMHKMMTEEDESPLQLAIKNNSMTSIVEELLNNDADANELDKDSNTIIHLAMKYSDNPEILKLLLNKVDINILNVYNDHGNTALHVGVSEDKFYLCKTLLEFIDKNQNIKTVGVGIKDKRLLLKEYRTQLYKLSRMPPKPLNQLKQSIINRTNRTNGRTALFLALSNRLENAELMILMLLVHFADPRITDFNGMDCSAYASDNQETTRYNEALDNSTTYFAKLSFNVEKASSFFEIID